MKKIIRSIKDLIKDNIEDIKRHIPRDIIEDKKNDLLKTQIYPSGKNLIKILNIDAEQRLKEINISEKSKIALGTCFAEEIAYILKIKKKN